MSVGIFRQRAAKVPLQPDIAGMNRRPCDCETKRKFQSEENRLREHPKSLVSCGMEVSETVQCPICGQSFEIAVDTSAGSQHFTTDCEICCRPFEVIAECEPGQILSLEVRGN